ncbi:hypothetical protein PoB_003248600 [Plakobranchus ocellatus]|uniref:Uncharacterized protein n=1 Tax=Plakobranchus ocellatus TaxID=259542 RepID=A0AAV4A406_9GAST|nr:hypothetical protein PoB_003248600 [Plakobranchus ocellatus]
MRFDALMAPSESSTEPLKLSCRFETYGTNMTKVAFLKIEGLNTERDMTDFRLVTAVNSNGVIYGIPSSVIWVYGEKNDDSAFLHMRYRSTMQGYCFNYRCLALGVDKDGNVSYVSETKEVGARPGRYCRPSQK